MRESSGKSSSLAPASAAPRTDSAAASALARTSPGWAAVWATATVRVSWGTAAA